MALTGLQIFKLLPNKNCGECGVPTCLAFAMKLAGKTAEPRGCPYISEQSLEILDASQSPPVKKITFKLKEKTVTIGAETVMHRHDKTFVNQPAVILELNNNLSDSDFAGQIKKIKDLNFERVGEILCPDGIFLAFGSNDPENYLSKLKVLEDFDGILILPELGQDLLKQVLGLEKNLSRIAVHYSGDSDISAIKAVAGDSDMKIIVSAEKPDMLFELVSKAENAGFRNIILKLDRNSQAELLRNNVLFRRLAIKKNFKPASYPVLTECGDDLFSAVISICRYSSIMILKKYSAETLFPLLTLRQNIYTDPQKPLQIQPGVYNIGEPGTSSPLLVTTNFSLTYFIVSGEIENSPFQARLLITDSEGMSVLTAWSANKFSAGIIAKAVLNSEVEKNLSHKKLIIPGYVSVLKGELEDELKDWEIIVGPQEAADIPVFLKETWK